MSTNYMGSVVYRKRDVTIEVKLQNEEKANSKVEFRSFSGKRFGE